jgi:hypothetical protein
MEYKCRKSCGICNGGDGYDALECLDLADEGETQCREWAWQGEWYVLSLLLLDSTSRRQIVSGRNACQEITKNV